MYISFQLSAFGMIWAALLIWISKSSLAYVYVLDRNSVELLIANEWGYLEKIVMKDGEIRFCVGVSSFYRTYSTIQLQLNFYSHHKIKFVLPF
jgi:hypothetical protein